MTDCREVQEHIQHKRGPVVKPLVDFDKFADGYDSGMDCQLKRLVGGTAEAFIDVKVRWLLRDLTAHPLMPKPVYSKLNVLDFGCGTGVFLELLRRNGLDGRFHGCDVSRGMLDEAIKNWHQGKLPKFDLITDGQIPYPDGFFDVAVACSVFHHISPRLRLAVCQELSRVLRPTGRLYVFEHNPYNPVTQWVVNRTAIDRDAVLLTVKEMRKLAVAAGLRDNRSEYFLFFFPTWQRFRPLERMLRWLPIGGQWILVAGNERQ